MSRTPNRMNRKRQDSHKKHQKSSPNHHEDEGSSTEGSSSHMPVQVLMPKNSGSNFKPQGINKPSKQRTKSTSNKSKFSEDMGQASLSKKAEVKKSPGGASLEIAQVVHGLMSETPARVSNEPDLRDLAHQSVQFVLEHSKEGTLSLCAAISDIFKIKLELEDKVVKLQEELAAYKANKELKVKPNLEGSKSHLMDYLQQIKQDLCQAIDFISKTSDKKSKPIFGCLCEDCSGCSNKDGVSPPVSIGEKVAIHEGVVGTVKYVGHLASSKKSSIYVGLDMIKAYGDNDGELDGIRYFKCQFNHGMFVSLHDIHYILD